MEGNAKDRLKRAVEDLCCAENHLNTAYIHAEDDHNRTEIHAALKSVAAAVEHAQHTVNYYED